MGGESSRLFLAAPRQGPLNPTAGPCLLPVGSGTSTSGTLRRRERRLATVLSGPLGLSDLWSHRLPKSRCCPESNAHWPQPRRLCSPHLL